MEEYSSIFSELVYKMAENAINGNIVGGHNGPYYDEETPFRVMSHWMVSFAEFYNRAEEPLLYEAVETLAEYILLHQEKNGTFVCRNKDKKDKINGLIGLAWIIEGLIAGEKTLQDRRCLDCAKRIFFSQPFDIDTGFWKRVDIDGKTLDYDSTFNHQLWFAAAGSLISNYEYDEKIDQYIKCFLYNSQFNFQIYPDGLCYHMSTLTSPFSTYIKSRIRFWQQILLRRIGLPSLEYKETGYHFFVMYGFAILHHFYSDDAFWKNRKFIKALDYSKKMTNIQKLLNNVPQKDSTGTAGSIKSEYNVYGFPYNSPAFELPLVAKEFFDDISDESLNELLKIQIDITFDKESGIFCRNTADPITLTARVYEYMRSI